ncbi:MAG: hypothetical protein JST90_07950 [Bacteroidetes bacterium]|nr:hypothetical protein [Bacteroidota bacterium]
MIEKFERKGIFYLPRKRENAIHGTLYYAAKTGLTLDLIGSFPNNTERSLKLIHGELQDGKAVTLFNSFEIHLSFSSQGMTIAKYASNYLFMGDALFTSERDISFNKVEVHYSHIENWLNVQSGFKSIEFEPKVHKISLEYELPKPIAIPLTGGKSINLKFRAKPPAQHMMLRTGISIKQKTSVEFKYPRKAQLWSVFDDVYHFKSFLTLCLQRPAFIKQMRGFAKIGNLKKLYEVEIYFSQGMKIKEPKELYPMDILMPYRDLAEILPMVIKSWYDNKIKLRPTEEPFFITYHERQYFTSDKFLHLTRALEAFHRDTMNSKKIFYSIRLAELQQSYSKLYNKLLRIKSRKEFTRKIVSLRNDFTHSNPVNQRNPDRFVKMHYLIENMRIMLSCILLNYHGIPSSTIVKRLLDSRLYSHIRKK